MTFKQKLLFLFGLILCAAGFTYHDTIEGILVALAGVWLLGLSL